MKFPISNKNDNGLKLKLLLFLLFSFLFVNFSSAQNVDGVVKSSSLKPISNAIISLLKNDSLSVLGYAITNDDGKFIIKSDNLNNISFIKVTAIGYKNILIKLPKSTDSLQFVLDSQSVTLPEVKVIEQKAIVQRSDTLDYNVGSFAKPTDNNVEDVLKKLPGIEVKENGQILYQGKPINKFYIDGDDLTGSRYNLATKTLPPDIIDKIQILENFQAINTLKGIIDDDRASLNLKLKSSSKLKATGIGKTGAGFGESRLADFNFFLFKNKLKFLNVLNYNQNINKLSSLLTDFESINRIQNNNLAFQKPIFNHETYLTNFPEERWQLNKSGLFSANTAFKIHENNNLKINVSYSPEYFTSQIDNIKAYQIGDSSYKQFEENKDSSLNQQMVLNLEYEANEKKSYFSDKLSLNYSTKKYRSGLITDIGNYNENFKSSMPNFQNNLSIIRPIKGGHLLKIDSRLGYLSFPERLIISPGIRSLQLNIDGLDRNFTQQFGKKSYSSNNTIALITKKNNLTTVFSLSNDLESDFFEGTQLLTDSLKNVKELNPENIPSFKWLRNVSTFDSKFVYNYKDIEISIDLPLNYRTQNYWNTTDNLSNKKSRFLYFSPLFNLRFDLSSDQHFNLSIRRDRSLGKADNFITGVIADSYRSTSSHPFILPSVNTISHNFNYSYKNVLKMFFASVGTFYISSSQNTINKTNFDDSGIINTSIYNFDNTSKWYSIYTNLNKYFFSLKSSVNFDLSINQINNVQNQNNLIFHSKSNNLNLGLDFISQPNNIIEVKYSVAFLFSKTKNLELNNQSSFTSLNQKLTTTILATENLNIKPTIDWVRINNGLNRNESFLMDFDVEQSFKKNKIKLGFSIRNLLNTPAYFEREIGLNSNTETAFYLKPLTALAFIKFRF